jgi:hypothetical protein
MGLRREMKERKKTTVLDYAVSLKDKAAPLLGTTLK